MGLAQTQQVLAQLYTSTELREHFFANPHVVGRDLGLSCDEVQQLAQLLPQQVNIFANSLKWKRLGEVRELLPRTARVLGKNFTPLFWRYAETYFPQGIKKHREDAIAFASFITKIAQEEDISPPWIGDLVRYEKTWLLAYKATRCLHVRWLRYPVGKLASLEEINRQPGIVIWLRFSARSQLHNLTIFLSL